MLGTKKQLRVLVVEDMAADMALINYELRRAGLNFRSRRVESRDAFLHELEHHPPDVILSDHGVPGFDGFAALEEARDRCPEVPFIFVTGAPRDEAATETLQSGADDYVLKNSLHLLVPAIQRALTNERPAKNHLQLEAALLNAEEQLHLLAREVKEYATFMLDAQGRVASWNPGAEQMLGYEPNEILGKQFDQFLPGSARETPPPRKLLERAADQNRLEERGWLLRKDGTLFRANTTFISLRGPAQNLRGFLCILRDESHHTEETEAQVRERVAQLEAENREMEELAHAIALDLREPIRRIESFTELLSKSFGEQLDPKRRGYLKTISDAAHQMSRLTDDLFTFSRIGRAEMYRLHVSLSEITKEVIHDLRHETEGRAIDWALGDLPEAMGDPVMLWRVMTNLISNALKFTRPRERARIEIGSETKENEIIVFVRDNGVGFDNHCADRLFGVFQRLHTKEFEGTGVGLANVRRIIQRHGGRVWAEGIEHEGATFYFSLPR